MKYQLVVKALYEKSARLKVADIVGGEDIVSIKPLGKMPERYVAIVDVDLETYEVSAFEAALNWALADNSHPLSTAHLDLVWWSRVDGAT